MLLIKYGGTVLVGSSETPEQLFAKCEANARVADKTYYRQALSVIAGILTFPDDLFGPEDTDDSVSPTGDVALQQIIRQASRYRDLLQWLKEYPRREQRWILLAIWLKQEKICEPREFLPAELYDNLTAEKRAQLQISITDLQHYDRVEAWRPYFERLLKDRHQNKSGDPEADLKRAGYDTAAINAARKKRQAIPAVCEWLEDKLGIEATTLRNAHSRMSSKKTSQIL